jgi:hypothetical protein
LEYQHLVRVREAVVVHELRSKLDIQHSGVLYLLEAYDTETGHVDGSTEINLALAPLSKSCPHINVCVMRDDVSNRVWVAPEVPFNCFQAESFNINIAIALHI